MSSCHAIRRTDRVITMKCVDLATKDILWTRGDYFSRSGYLGDTVGVVSQIEINSNYIWSYQMGSDETGAIIRVIDPVTGKLERVASEGLDLPRRVLPLELCFVASGDAVFEWNTGRVYDTVKKTKTPVLPSYQLFGNSSAIDGWLCVGTNVVNQDTLEVIPFSGNGSTSYPSVSDGVYYERFNYKNSSESTRRIYSIPSGVTTQDIPSGSGLLVNGILPEARRASRQKYTQLYTGGVELCRGEPTQMCYFGVDGTVGNRIRLPEDILGVRYNAKAMLTYENFKSVALTDAREYGNAGRIVRGLYRFETNQIHANPQEPYHPIKIDFISALEEKVGFEISRVGYYISGHWIEYSLDSMVHHDNRVYWPVSLCKSTEGWNDYNYSTGTLGVLEINTETWEVGFISFGYRGYLQDIEIHDGKLIMCGSTVDHGGY